MYRVEPPNAASKFEKSVEEALQGYEEIARGKLFFDADQAVQLKPVEGKLYTAKSESSIYIPKRIVGGVKKAQAKLVTVLFNPVDATGSEPRSKAGVNTEVHLAIASYKTHEDLSPKVFTGNLALIGLEGGEVKRVADLGQSRSDFVNLVNGQDQASPTATLTVGRTSSGDRFGDPHYVSNPWDQVVQVAGFIALDRKELGIADLLAAQRPNQI